MSGNRYKLTIEYDGAPFVGWQAQTVGVSVQRRLEEAVFKFAGESVLVAGAGRTDAGVHALGQVAHVDLERPREPDRIMAAINAHLRPDPIAVVAVEAVSPDFDARFSAIARHYRFRIANRRARLTLDRGKAWHVAHRLDAEAMHQAAQVLVGPHDFTTFRSIHCQSKSPVKTLDVLDVERVGDEIAITASARSFMHNQVRSMVGTLKLAGEGKWTAADVAAALQAKDRARCGPVAPPDGLYLVAVDYPVAASPK